jgi:hypothetical protein
MSVCGPPRATAKPQDRRDQVGVRSPVPEQHLEHQMVGRAENRCGQPQPLGDVQGVVCFAVRAGNARRPLVWSADADPNHLGEADQCRGDRRCGVGIGPGHDTHEPAFLRRDQHVPGDEAGQCRLDANWSRKATRDGLGQRDDDRASRRCCRCAATRRAARSGAGCRARRLVVFGVWTAYAQDRCAGKSGRQCSLVGNATSASKSARRPCEALDSSNGPCDRQPVLATA